MEYVIDLNLNVYKKLPFVFYYLDANPFANLLNAQPNVNAPFSGNAMPFGAFPSMPLFPPMSMNAIPPPIPTFAFNPPPTVPTNLSELSEEELRALEGNERQNVEERIKVGDKLFSFVKLCLLMLIFANVRFSCSKIFNS